MRRLTGDSVPAWSWHVHRTMWGQARHAIERAIERTGRGDAHVTIAFTHDTLMAELERESGILLLDFWASWCAPCRAFAPIYDKVAKANPDITFGKVDTEVEQRLAAAFAIRSIPTLMIFRDGVLLFAQPGMLPEAALTELVANVRTLDMDEVRAKIAEAEAGAGPAEAGPAEVEAREAAGQV